MGEPVNGVVLTWISSLDNQIGSGGALTTASLSDGTHQIVLFGEKGGGTSADSVVIHVWPGAPDSWRYRESLSTPRSSLVSVTIDGKVYAAGGSLNSTGGRTGELEVHDPLTDSWTLAASMPFIRSGSASAVVAGTLLVIGGRDPDSEY